MIIELIIATICFAVTIYIIVVIIGRLSSIEKILAGIQRDMVVQPPVLPETLDCPECKTNITLDMLERKTGHYSCPECGHKEQEGIHV